MIDLELLSEIHLKERNITRLCFICVWKFISTFPTKKPPEPDALVQLFFLGGLKPPINKNILTGLKNFLVCHCSTQAMVYPKTTEHGG